jgi:membrane protein implicated in regulation of membrane protease activity
VSTTPVIALLVLLAGVALVLLWKLLLTAGCIGLVQWAVITHSDGTTVQVLTYAIPALLAAFVLNRLFSARHLTTAPQTTSARKGVQR